MFGPLFVGEIVEPCENLSNSLLEKSASSGVNTYPDTKRRERHSPVLFGLNN